MMNPYLNADLKWPDEHSDLKDQLTRKHTDLSGKAKVVASAPFERMADAWLLAVALGARTGVAPKGEASTSKFATGVVLRDDEVDFLDAVAVGIRGSEILKAPEQVIRLANSLAAVGVADIAEALSESSCPATWALADYVNHLLMRPSAPGPGS